MVWCVHFAGINFEMFHSHERSILRQYPVLSSETFKSLVVPRNAIMLQHLVLQFLYSNFCSIISQRVAYVRLKTTENVRLLALSSRSGCSQEIAKKHLVFCKTGRRGGWLLTNIQLYVVHHIKI